MTRGVGYAPLGKSKTIPTPDANRNNKPVKTSGDKTVSYTHLTLPTIYSV